MFLGVSAILQRWVTSSYIQIWLWPGLMKWIQESGNFRKVSWNVLIWRKSTLTKVVVTLSLNKQEWVPLELVSSNRGLVGSTIAFYFYISISTLSLNKQEWVPLELVSSNRGLVGSTIAFYFYISISHTPSQNSVFKSRPVPVAVRNWWLAANVLSWEFLHFTLCFFFS